MSNGKAVPRKLEDGLLHGSGVDDEIGFVSPLIAIPFSFFFFFLLPFQDVRLGISHREILREKIFSMGSNETKTRFRKVRDQEHGNGLMNDGWALIAELNLTNTPSCRSTQADLASLINPSRRTSMFDW